MLLKHSVVYRTSFEGPSSKAELRRGHAIGSNLKFLPAVCFDFNLGTRSKSSPMTLAFTARDFEDVISTMMELDREATVNAFAKAVLKPVKG